MCVRFWIVTLNVKSKTEEMIHAKRLDQLNTLFKLWDEERLRNFHQDKSKSQYLQYWFIFLNQKSIAYILWIFNMPLSPNNHPPRCLKVLPVSQLEEICLHSQAVQTQGAAIALPSCPEHCGKAWASSRAVPEKIQPLKRSVSASNQAC